MEPGPRPPTGLRDPCEKAEDEIDSQSLAPYSSLEPGPDRARRPHRVMIVCHCHACTDRDVRQAVRCGAWDQEEVGRLCGAGRSCGGCRETILKILRDEARSRPVPEAAKR